MENRDVDAIRGYHDATKHSVASVYHTRHTLDWETMPRPFKVYTDLPAIPLPRDFASSTRPALAAIADPGTASGSGPSLDRAALARLLYFSAGIVRRRTYSGGEIYFRAAACTGALYHIDLYLVCGALPDLEAGVYHFGPHDFALRQLRTGDFRAALVEATGGDPAIAGTPAVLIATTTFWRNAWKYRARAYRHAFWDAGTLAANLLGVAAAHALPARVVVGFVDDRVNALLDVDTVREVALALVPLGAGAPMPAAAPPAPPLAYVTLPPSSREVDYPEIGRAHAASSLASDVEVAAWRGTLPAPSFRDAPGPVVPLAPDVAVAEPIETVILRRGSTRTFGREPVSFAALSTILRSATRGVPIDVATHPDVYLLVHAVDGLTPGTYHFDRRADGLVLLREGSFRREAGHLGLGQDLPADAAFDVFWLVDLEPVLARYGNRGYRAAQLEAAIEAGKTYLTAFGVRIGATGLTFFDDDVTAFFSPHAAGKSVMFLMAFGRPRRATLPS